MSEPTVAPPPARRPADESTYHVDPGHGWILFAGIMLAFIGVLNVIYGIAAISNSKFYARDIQFVIGNLKTWGWFLLVIGIAQLITAIGVWRNSEVARWVGVGFAFANGIVQLLVLPAHPAWALTVFFLDIIVAYGLIMYGGRDRYSLR